MPGPEFFQTMMGKRYYESQLPRQTKATERLAAAIEKQNELAEAAKPHPEEMLDKIELKTLTRVGTDYQDLDDRLHYIDGFFKEDGEYQGKQIAVVCMDTQKVIFLDHRFRVDPMVLEAIQEIKAKITKEESPKAPKTKEDVEVEIEDIIVELRASNDIPDLSHHETMGLQDLIGKLVRLYAEE